MVRRPREGDRDAAARLHLSDAAVAAPPPLCSFTLEADERKIRERGGGGADAPVARHSWLAKQSSADLESEFRDAADESTSLLHRPRSRFDTGQFSRDAAQ